MSVNDRVFHVVPALFGWQDGVIGGAERYALELARHMARQVPTTLVTFGEKNHDESIDDLRIKIIGHPHYVRGQRQNPFSKSLFRVLRDATIVHCHQQHVLASSLTALYCRLSGRRVFVSDLGGGGWDLSAYVSTDRWYHGHLHISEYSRKILGHEGFSRAQVILGGVDTNVFTPDPCGENDGTVLFVGRLLPHKGVNYLVEAAPPDMPVEIVGQVENKRFYEDLKKLADGKQVTFRHDCGDEELVEAYRKALCVVLPSVYTDQYGSHTEVPELLGQTLLEGMACGTAAICTDVASMPEVVEDEKSGFIVPPNDPVALREKFEWLRSNPARRQILGEAGRERVLKKFTWEKVVQRCLSAYAGEKGTPLSETAAADSQWR